MFQYIKENGAFSQALYQANIVLLPKKDRDPNNVSSYRPVSLLTFETKLLSKILANRLESHIAKIVHPDQNGFIPNRRIFFNLRRVFNIIYDPICSKENNVLISLDAEKAFDQIEWEYMFAVLEKFGFGKRFMDWIRIIYKEPSASVITNGQRSPPFRLYKGMRQGDPLSPFIFALALEPLACHIRSSPNIHPITCQCTKHKFSAYADDVVLFISNPEVSVTPLLKLINVFGSFSGYKINWDKSELMPHLKK